MQGVAQLSLALAWLVQVHAGQAPLLLQRGDVPSAASAASGAATAAKVAQQSVDVNDKLAHEVDKLAKEGQQKVLSLKSMLTTNSKSIAALTGLFKEISKLSSHISTYEEQLSTCRTELASVKAQQGQSAQNDAYFNSVGNDPLMGFLQVKSESALEKAGHSLEALTLLQTSHRRQVEAQDQDADMDAVELGLSTISGGDEDVDTRTRNVNRNNGGLVDPLEYGMYDFSGEKGVKIFDKASLDPEVQRRRQLEEVDRVSGRFPGGGHQKTEDEDDDEDDDDE